MTRLQQLFWVITAVRAVVGCSGNSDNLDQDLTDAQPSDLDCIDLFSFNDTWADNCVLKRSGIYAHSNYTYGVQRILWCLGYARDGTADPLNHDLTDSSQFISGHYDESTESAVRQYQGDQEIESHGAVGSATWSSLRQEILLLGAAASEYSSYSINGEGCDNLPFFFQRNSEPYDWRMISPTNENDQVEFTAIEPTISVD